MKVDHERRGPREAEIDGRITGREREKESDISRGRGAALV